MDFYYFDTGGIKYDPINLNVILTFSKTGVKSITFYTVTDMTEWIFDSDLQRNIIFDQLIGLSTQLIP